MSLQVKYSQVIKKFNKRNNSNKVWSHLELYGPDISSENEEQDSRQGLLADDEEANHKLMFKKEETSY